MQKQKLTANQKKANKTSDNIIKHINDIIENTKTLKSLKTTWQSAKVQKEIQSIIEKSIATPPKPPKDKNEPTGARNSFLMFCATYKSKPEHKSAKLEEIRDAWKTASDKHKKIFEKEAEKDLERYNRELREYKKTANYKKHQKILDAWYEEHDIERVVKRRKDVNKPKPVKSAYNRFLTHELAKLVENAQKNDHVLTTEEKKILRQEISKKWKNFGKRDPTKEKFEDEQIADQKRYDKEMDEWKPRASYVDAECAYLSAQWAKKTYKKLTPFKCFQLERIRQEKIKNIKRKQTPTKDEFKDEWEDMSEEEKAEYAEKAEALTKSGQVLVPIKEEKEEKELARENLRAMLDDNDDDNDDDNEMERDVDDNEDEGGNEEDEIEIEEEEDEDEIDFEEDENDE